jgi:hypothetical protein
MSEPLSKEEYIELQAEIQRRYVESVAKFLEPLLVKLNPHVDPVRRREDLRDSFACAAMQALAEETNASSTDYINGLARLAYRYADVMLEARDMRHIPQKDERT